MNPENKLDHNNEVLKLGKIKLSKVISVNKTENKEIVYDLKVKNNENYVISNLGIVHNGGKRAGAGTVALPIWHNDILDFLDSGTEAGDLRLKSFDIFLQVTVPDIFIERDKNAEEWTTFCPYEVKKVLGIDIRGLYGDEFRDAYLTIEKAADAGKLKVIRKFESARELTKIIMRVQFETGLPYIAFTDTINKYNPNKGDDNGHIGVPCTNLCTESNSNVKPDELGHVCNLASIVLGNIKDLKELAKISRLTTRILDFGINLTNAPDKITNDHNNRYRTIGVGLQGLHDHLVKEGLNFRDLDYIREMTECVQYNSILESTILAKSFGSFNAFDKSEWKNGNRISLFKEHASGKYDWDLLQNLINENGMRNSQTLSPAPNTSTSIYMDSSASVLPVYDAFFSEDNKNGRLVVAAKFLKKNPLGYGKTFAKHTATEIINVVSEIQKFTDTGISMELIFDHRNENFKAKDLYDAIHYAHEKGIKAIYYIRSIKKNATLETKPEENCVACAG